MVTDPYISSNEKGAPPGRLVAMIIDQGNIRAGQGRSVMDQARRFIDTLQPEDRVLVAGLVTGIYLAENPIEGDPVDGSLGVVVSVLSGP